MKFLVTWRVHDEQRHEALKGFSAMTPEDDSADLGSVRLIGRWHDLVGFTGVAIAEADDMAPMAALLCSPLSRFIVGQNIVIDGGQHHSLF